MIVSSVRCSLVTSLYLRAYLGFHYKPTRTCQSHYQSPQRLWQLLFNKAKPPEAGDLYDVITEYGVA